MFAHRHTHTHTCTRIKPGDSTGFGKNKTSEAKVLSLPSGNIFYVSSILILAQEPKKGKSKVLADLRSGCSSVPK